MQYSCDKFMIEMTSLGETYHIIICIYDYERESILFLEPLTGYSPRYLEKDKKKLLTKVKKLIKQGIPPSPYYHGYLKGVIGLEELKFKTLLNL